MKISLLTVFIELPFSGLMINTALKIQNLKGQTHFTTMLLGLHVRNKYTCEGDLSESAACVRANSCKQADGLVCKDRAMRQV